MYGRSNMETYITICKIESQSEFAIWQKKKKSFVRELPKLVKNILLHVVRDGLKKSDI